MTIFEQARQAITRSLIEVMFSTPGACWDADEYWTLSPLRIDKKIGSFSINISGAYNDFSTNDKGGYIDLVAKSRNLSEREAAEEIVRRGGGDVQDNKPPPQTAKKKKSTPVIPIPAIAGVGINEKLKAGKIYDDTAEEWVLISEKYGPGVKGWKYHTAEGGWAFSVVRHEKDGKKEIIPYYYGEDSKWHQGQPYKTGRPLYHLHELIKSDLAVLVVEGERCADIKVPGYIITTWAGGSSAVSKTDWAPLAKRDVLIWPDADDAGIKAAAAIRNRLPHAKILQIKDKPSGWDIADCEDPAQFIAECPVMEESETAKIPNDCEIDFFQSLSHGSGADIMRLRLKNHIFEAFDRRGNGEFFEKKNGTAYYQLVLDPKAMSRRILEQASENAFEYMKINVGNGDIKSVYSQSGKAVKKSRTRDFLNGVLAMYSEKIILDPIPRNETPEALPCLDKIIDFSGKKPFARDPRPGEYFFDPVPLRVDDILSAIETPHYDRFLKQLFPDPDTLITARYVLSLSVANKGSKYFTLWYGPLGNNAKNTLMDLNMHVLGNRAVSLKGALVLKGGDKSERRFGEIELRSRTVGFFDEVGGHFDIAQIKRLTSLSYIRGENKGEKSVQFLQTWSLNALCNRLPTFYPADDTAFISRILVLPFVSVFYASQEDRKKYLNRGVKSENLHPARDKDELMAELISERAGILRYMIYDFLDLRESLRGKILESSTCQTSKEKYRRDNDLIERFFDDSLIHDEYNFISNQKLLELYEDFSGNKKMTARKLVDILVDRFSFITRSRSSAARGIMGVNQKNDDSL